MRKKRTLTRMPPAFLCHCSSSYLPALPNSASRIIRVLQSCTEHFRVLDGKLRRCISFRLGRTIVEAFLDALPRCFDGKTGVDFEIFHRISVCYAGTRLGRNLQSAYPCFSLYHEYIIADRSSGSPLKDPRERRENSL
jgi:hypothetical protein